MTTTVAELVAPAEREETPSGLVWLVRDSWTEAVRHLRALPRNPELLMFATIQPVMFVLLFVYVFGGAIEVPGYPDYFSYAFSWIQAWMGLSVGSVEAANSAGFLWMFPLTFVSSAFVDPSTMPEWLQPIARNNPFTIVTNATRALYNGRPPGSDLWVAIAWASGITVVFAGLAARKFISSAAR